MKSRNSIVFFACAVSAAVVGMALPSVALDRRIHGAYCAPVDSSSASVLSINTNIGWTVNSTTTDGSLACPIPDDSYLGHGAVNPLNVHGKDGHPSLQACATPILTFYDARSPGYQQGTQKCSGLATVGQFTLSFTASDLSWGAGASDFAEVFITIPRQTSGLANSYFRGIWLST